MRVCLFFLLSTLCILSSCSQKTKSPPNIILINADDLGAHHLGTYGQEVITTPRLDQMAKEGIKFQNGYSSATTCGPSRVALLLGKHVGHLAHFQRKNGALSRVFREQIAFPELLQDAGYETVMFGKHHNVRLSPSRTPMDDLPSHAGFDLSIGTFSAMDAHQYYLDGVTAPHQNYAKNLWKDENGVVSPYVISPDRYTHNEYVDLALNYIQNKHSSPYFLYLSFQIPHWEITVPQKGHADYKKEDEGLLEQYLDEDGKSIFDDKPYAGSGVFLRSVDQPAAIHAGMISRLDRDVGKILDKLRDLNLDENTIVIFTSDNGRVGTPGGDHFKINMQVRGAKASLYEGGIKVPFIFWGGGIKGNTVIEEPIIMHDLPSTILDIAQVDSLFATDGISWRKKLFGSSEEIKNDYIRHLYWENYHSQACQAVLIDNQFKVIKSNCSSDNYKLELYDLRADPAEKNNLASSKEVEHLLSKAKELFILEHAPFKDSGIVF